MTHIKKKKEDEEEWEKLESEGEEEKEKEDKKKEKEENEEEEEEDLRSDKNKLSGVWWDLIVPHLRSHEVLSEEEESWLLFLSFGLNCLLWL